MNKRSAAFWVAYAAMNKWRIPRRIRGVVWKGFVFPKPMERIEYCECGRIGPRREGTVVGLTVFPFDGGVSYEIDVES